MWFWAILDLSVGCGVAAWLRRARCGIVECSGSFVVCWGIVKGGELKKKSFFSFFLGSVNEKGGYFFRVKV